MDVLPGLLQPGLRVVFCGTADGRGRAMSMIRFIMAMAFLNPLSSRSMLPRAVLEMPASGFQNALVIVRHHA